jgi:hypothetical protein
MMQQSYIGTQKPQNFWDKTPILGIEIKKVVLCMAKTQKLIRKI